MAIHDKTTSLNNSKHHYSLKALLKQMGIIGNHISDVQYNNIALDSRKVMPGNLFIAVPGDTADGRQFIDQAIDKGAVAVLAQQDNLLVTSYVHNKIPIYAIHSLLNQLGDTLHQWFQKPSEKLISVGITGTNGKTSCSIFLAQALQSLNISAGVMGTIGKGIYPHLSASGNTTPGLLDVHTTMAEWVNKNVPWALMEVTSHALCQRRVDGVQFDTALYTNMSRDHLDYHQTMEAYIEAKSQLFSFPTLKHAVINIDDDYAKVMINHLKPNVNLLTYSIKNTDADIYLKKHTMAQKNVEAWLVSPWGEGAFSTQLFGRFNLYNLLGVIGVLGAHAISINDLLAVIPQMGRVPGRMAVYGKSHEQPQVIVDYSHTPDALKNALQAIKEHGSQRIICVFGCGGDRDRGKRPLMMKVALNYADHIVVTSDNPRFENPKKIIDEVIHGVSTKDKSRITISEDRKEAIKQAILQAKPEDIVLVAGKGHENYQDIKGTKYHLDDTEEVEKALKCYPT